MVYWKSSKVEIRDIASEFKGIFAAKDIKEGEYIFRNWNDLCLMLTIEDVKQLPLKHRIFFEKYATELYEGTFVGPYETEDISSMSEYFINHSCDPNSWLVSDGDVAARRNISSGEEITIDYATFIINHFKTSKIDPCLCGTAVCRGKVDNNDWWRMKDVYQGHFLSWIQQKINKKEEEMSNTLLLSSNLYK